MTSALVLEIHTPDGSAVRHPLGSGLVVGSGPGADVRLGAETGLAARHFRLVPSDDGAAITLEPEAATGVIAGGVEQRGARIASGEEVYVGRLRLCVLPAVRARGPSPLLLGILLVAFALAGALGSGIFDPPEPSAREVEAPALYSRTATCDAADAPVAEHRARSAEQAAAAKAERFAFDFRDGVEALAFYDESRACFARVGLVEDAARVGRRFTAWRARLDEEYAAARLRLRLAIDQDRAADAIAQATELTALLSRVPAGPYVEWLGAVRREMARKTAQKREP